MKNQIIALLKESINVKEDLIKSSEQLDNMVKLSEAILKVIKSGNKIMIFGNGGSAADSLHVAAEFVGRFKKERRALPAIALPTNISTLTALGNDYSFDYIFERQIEAFGNKGDLAIGLSTSGKSENIIRGILKASEKDITTAVLTGKDKTRLSEIADIAIMVPSANTPRIQETHIAICHVICELVENAL